jgi:hypothetical protein
MRGARRFRILSTFATVAPIGGGAMPDFQRIDDLLDALAMVLLRCFLLGMVLLLVWAGVFLAAGDLLYRLWGPLFALSQHEMNLMHFYGIMFVKCLVLLFFLFPHIAIRLVLRKRRCGR